MKFFIYIVTVIAFIGNFFSIGECREVVFVLNSGQSMISSDPFNMARESIFWGMKNLYSQDETGIVTFNNDVQIIRPLSPIENNPVQNFSVNYYGQSNAGAGILTAIDMLSPKFNTQRDIIFITDGEISDSQSAENFKAGLKQAQWLGISVYLIDLRHNVDPKNYREYDAVKILPINYNELLTTMRTVLQGDFQTPHISLPTNNLTGGFLRFELPITSAEHLKITLFSTKPGTAHLEKISPGNIFQGNYVKIFDIKSPSTNSFEIGVTYPKDSGLTLDVVPEVVGTLKIDTTTKFLIKDILEITPMYENVPDTKILVDSFFDGKRINLKMNDKKISGEIQNGVIQIPLDNLEEKISLQKIHFEDVGIIFKGDDTAQIDAPKTHYGAWLLASAGILCIAFLTWRINRNRKLAAMKLVEASDMLKGSEKVLPIYEEKNSLQNNSSVSYNGRLWLYVTNLPENENFAPREFNLLRIHEEKILLSYILETCGIVGIFQNAKYIFIRPDEKKIIIENQSDCTITNRNVIVEKGEKILLGYNDSVNISSPDEQSELIMIYKSLKPE